MKLQNTKTSKKTAE